ncbi:MAG: hypothetical protein QOF62_168 [Pyrinomonadaceae bacterium]|jgi:hypothetical protein|nr:hypothetical protein [Pyrinomonadaceae bacterium]
MGKMTSSASLKKDHLQAIGLITVNFAMLEMTIAGGLWLLLGSEQKKGQIITAELSFKNLVALFSSLYRDSTDDSNKLEELESLIKRIMRAEEKRNIISHSLWAIGDSHATITRIKTTAKISKGLKHTFEQFTVADLEEIADEMSDTAADFQTFYMTDLRAQAQAAAASPPERA